MIDVIKSFGNPRELPLHKLEVMYNLFPKGSCQHSTVWAEIELRISALAANDCRMAKEITDIDLGYSLAKYPRAIYNDIMGWKTLAHQVMGGAETYADIAQ
jgi:hypothetical protein